MANKVSALSAAARAGQFAVSPDQAEAMTRELNTILDAVAEMRRKAAALALRTPLGGGYADQIGSLNASTGETAVRVLNDFREETVALRDSVRQSVANNYQGAEAGNTAGFNGF